MATTHPSPAPANGQPHVPVATNGHETGNTQALVALPPQGREHSEPAALSAPVSLLPVELDVAVPVRKFRVRNLLALEPGQLIESKWGNGEDVPLASGQVQLAWSEFEVIETQLAVRISRLA
jgi:flagellar motor switch protein FliN/FliY